MKFHESDLIKASFEEPFMFDDIVAVERTENIKNNGKNSIYTIYGFEITSEASDKDFTQFKTLYINQEFFPKAFFSYTVGDLNKTFFVYERNKHQSEINFVFNPKTKKISVMIDPLTCETIPDKTYFEIDISSENISIIDKLNILKIFDILDKKSAKILIDKKTNIELYRYYVKGNTEYYSFLKKTYPRLLLD